MKKTKKMARRRKRKRRQAKDGLTDYSNMLLRNVTENEHPYKEEIRQFKELEAVNTEEQLLVKIKEDFKSPPSRSRKPAGDVA